MNGVLFTPEWMHHRPQWFFPSRLKGEVFAWLAESFKTGTLNPTGVSCGGGKPHESKLTADQQAQVILDMLETHPLGIDLLSGRPLQIHNIRFMTVLPPEYYQDLRLPVYDAKNKAKVCSEKIGATRVRFSFAPNGTVEIIVINTKAPFATQTEEDRSIILNYLGAVRDRLAGLVNDRGYMNIPVVPGWFWTYLEANKDFPIYHWRLYAPYSFQFRQLDLWIKVYVKALEKDAVKRFETGKAFDRQKTLQIINDHLNPGGRLDRVEQTLLSIQLQHEMMTASLEKLVNVLIPSSTARQEAGVDNQAYIG